MGEIELDIYHHQLIIYSNIITYGNAVTTELTEQIREEIETLWNEPAGYSVLKEVRLNIVFKINAH